MNNLIDGLFLDTYHVPISYTCGMQEVVYALPSAASCAVSENQLTIASKLLGLENTFQITFSFGANSIERVSVSPLQANGDDASKERFRSVQKKLASILGFPANVIGSLLNACNGDSKKYVWVFRNVEITHALWEHFGFREEIVIQPIRAA